MAGEPDGSPSLRADRGENGHAAETERTPLLGQPGQQDPQDRAGNDSQEEERTVLSKELSTTRLVLIMGTAYLGVFLGAADSTIIATLSGPISSEFHSLSLFSWLATAYLIANAACQPISGRLTDIFGRGPGLIVSNIFFAAGNLICGLAKDNSSMILGRVIAGIGGGGLMSISTFLASDLIPLRKRGVVQGLGNLCYGSGAMLGGVFGGLLNDHTKLGWRLAFFVQVPPVLVSAVAVAFLVKIPPKQSDKSYLARIDFFGVFLTLSFLVLLLLGLNAGGNLVPWKHPLPLTTIPLSLVAFAGFLWWESRVKQPIIPVQLLRTQTIFAACVCNLLATMVIIGGMFYVPLYLQVRGDSATEAGAKILPAPLGIAVGSILSGYIMNRTGRYTKLGIGSLVIFVVGVALLNFQGPTTPAWITYISFFCIGAGHASMLTCTLLACIASVDHSQQAVVTSATYLARSLGGTIGVTLASSVYQSILKMKLWDAFGQEPDAAEKINRIRNNLDSLKDLPEGWYDAVMTCFMQAFQGVWITFLVLAIGALVSISFLKHHTLHATMDRH